MSIFSGKPRPSASPTWRPRDVFYGWWLVGVSAFLLTLMSVTVFQGLGTFIVALEREFHWSRTTLNGAFALARVQGAVIGPVEGFLIDRFGPRRMILVGYTIMGLGFLMLSQVNSVWQFYVGFIVVTLGSGLGGWLAIIAMVNNWFSRRRSFALATAMSGIHLGGFLVPVLAFGIDSHGFRVTMLGIGVFLLVLVFPVTRAIRNRPEDYGLRPDGDPLPSQESKSEPAATLPESEAEFTPAQALRTRAFWIITIVHVSSSVSIVTLALNLVPKLTDMGMTLTGAGIVVLTYTAVALPSQFVVGWFADKLPKPPVIFVFLTLQAVSILIIAVADTRVMAFLFAVLYGIGFGGRIPLLTAIRGDYFGRKAFATIMGLSQFPNNIAMIGAPLFAGYMFDIRGSYFIPFTTFAALNFVGAVLMLFVRRPRIARPSPLVTGQQPAND